MRTIFTSKDVENFIEYLFNGNLRAVNLSNGKIDYENENSEQILLVDDETGEKTEFDLAKYLNIEFYSWKNRLIEQIDEPINSQPQYSTFENWVKSLNFSTNLSFALVEILDEEATASQDVDSATKIGKITFLISENKVSNLDYYISKIRNKLLGVPQTIQNCFGDMLNAYVVIGTLLYDQEPTVTQIGEVMTVSANFRISYLNEALSFGDTKIEISLNGDDLYDANSNIVDSSGEPTETKFMTMPITKMTWQNIFGSNPLPTWDRPDLTGFVANTLSTVKTISFYDFNKKLTMAFNDLFWRMSAYRVNGKIKETAQVNVPIYLRITSNGNVYTYKDMIDNMQKVLTNSDFNISSITIKGLALPSTDPAYLAQLSFDSNGGEPIAETITVFEDRPIGELPTPIRTGYNFVGWTIGGVIITEETLWTFGGDATAVAQWNAKTYSLMLDAGDGQIWQTKTVTFGQAIGELPIPTSGNTPFLEWKIGAVTILSSTIWNYDENKTAIAEYEPAELQIITTPYYGGGIIDYTITMGTNVTHSTINYTITTTRATNVPPPLPDPVSGEYTEPFLISSKPIISSTDITKEINAKVAVGGVVLATTTITVDYGGIIV